MNLIVNRWGRHHPSHDDAAEFEAAILNDPAVHAVGPVNQYLLATLYLLWRLRRRITRPASHTQKSRLTDRKPPTHQLDYFVILMSLNPQKCLPFFFYPGRKSVYLFDAWPVHFESICLFVQEWGIQTAFVSASQSAERLSSLVEGCTFHWVPEGVTPEAYHCEPLESKKIDVLQFGRKHPDYHEKILKPLEEAGKSYLFEQVPGQIIFPTRQAFFEALAETRISICFPSSLTHPQRSGDICTMTMRYLQSMVSGCLVVGSAPEEMLQLFGYNPVIQADMEDPAGQLLSILGNFEAYQDLIERNRMAIQAQHTWKHRWRQILSLI